jgi:hypothetical protein
VATANRWPEGCTAKSIGRPEKLIVPGRIHCPVLTTIVPSLCLPTRLETRKIEPDATAIATTSASQIPFTPLVLPVPGKLRSPIARIQKIYVPISQDKTQNQAFKETLAEYISM